MNSWRKVSQPSQQWQVTQYEVTTDELYTFEIGEKHSDVVGFATLQVFVNSKFIQASNYTEVKINDRYYITFTHALTERDVVTIKIVSDKVNALGYYEVPKNLENNADNQDFTELTVGQVRNHLSELSSFIPQLKGSGLGSNNIRDIDYKQYPGKILQHSAGNILPQYLLTSDQVSFQDAMRFSMEEYTRFKRKFLESINDLDLDLRQPSDAVDKIIAHLAGTKNNAFAFFHTDMIAWGSQKNIVYHTVDDILQTEFEFTTPYSPTTVGNTGVLVYRLRDHNLHLLTLGKDYTFDPIKTAINIDKTYDHQLNDQIQITQYENTDGNFIPPTPTKLGLWPKWEPRKYTDNSYSTDQVVVQGHDGSIWVAYGDIRDDIVLELEKRIFNNIKTEYSRELFDWKDVVPGYYRHPESQRSSVELIYRKYLASWAYKNRLNYNSNGGYTDSNGFTWNYSNSTATYDNKKLPGYWRGVYQWHYDTDTPHATPWEMLGHQIKPAWWQQRYGPAPYTSGNTVLWEDIAEGRIYTNGSDTTYTIDVQVKRPGILTAIPVDQQGNLVPPSMSVTSANTGSSSIRNDWVIGDNGPVESAWKRSSEWPFALQIVGGLMHPSKYFTLMFDTNLYTNYKEYDQILQTGRTYRPRISDYKFNGAPANLTDGTVNRIEGYNQYLSNHMLYQGKSISDLQTRIQNLKLNLVYKVAGYTDKKQLKVIIDAASPNSGNQNIFLPDENFHIHLNKSQPLDRVSYSGVNIVKHEAGYQITGFDTEDPVFRIIPSVTSNNRRTIDVGNTRFTLFDDSKNVISLIPYGTVLTSTNQVADFLVAHNRYLSYKGITFNGKNSDGKILNFDLSIREFGLFNEQNWNTGSVLSVSPGLSEITVDRPYTTVSSFTDRTGLRNNNSKPIRVTEINVERIDNVTTILCNTENEYLFSARLDPVQYEHVLVFDNSTIFGDIVYQPELGNRQDRLKIIGEKSSNWNGTIHAPGQLFNQDKFNIWTSQRDYKKADMASFRNKIYVSKADHVGTVAFDYNNWQEVPNMKTGMLLNPTAKADAFLNFYDFDNVNLESGYDKLGKGQIGFRSRDYLENLGIDDASQVKFYQGMLKGKGTSSTLDKLVKANLTNLNQEINVYEEWGFRVGEYGSIDSNQVIEIKIDEAKAQKNPFNIQLADNGETVDVDTVKVIEKDIFKKPAGYKTKLFLERDENTQTQDLLGAGFPRLDDVDFTVFDSNNLTTELTDVIDILGREKIVWVAKSDTQSWDIFRITEVNAHVIAIELNFETQVTCTTDNNHGLVKANYVVIKGNSNAKGVYKVSNVPAPNKFVIELAFAIDETAKLFLSVHKLVSVKYSSPNLIATTTPPYGWGNNEKVWVEGGANDKWAVYNKNNSYDSSSFISNSGVAASWQTGAALSVSADGLSLVTTAPGVDTLLSFVRGEDGTFVEGVNWAHESIGSSLSGFGDSVAMGNGWVAVGAPGTNSNRGAVFIYKRNLAGDLEVKQVIVPDIGGTDDVFGYSLAISNNDRFLYIGSPGSDEVYCYHLFTQGALEDNIATLTGDGSTTVFGLGFTTSGDQLTVEDTNSKLYLNQVDYTISGSNITFNTVPALNLTIVVRRSSHYKFLQRLSGTAGSRFGHSVATDANSQTLVVGAPHDSSQVNEGGSVQIFNQQVERFYGDGITTAYTPSGTLPENMEFIEVNGTTLIKAGGAFSTYTSDSSANRYARDGNVLSTRFIPADGDVIDIYLGSWHKVQVSYQGELQGNLASEIAEDSEHFGWDVAIDTFGSIVAVGAPGEDSTNPNTGSVYMFIDEGKRFGSITTKSSAFAADANETIFINNNEIVCTATTTPSVIKTIIDAKSIPEVSVVATDTTLTITSTNKTLNNKLSVRPGTGDMYESTSKLAFEPFRMTQKISHPYGADNENFGNRIVFNSYSSNENSRPQNLVISSDRATTLLPTNFDVVDTVITTTYDQGSTRFISHINESGAAYAYSLIEPGSTVSLSNPPLYAIHQQLRNSNIDTFDSFGSSIAAWDNKIFVGSKNDDQFKANGGSVYEFVNTKRTEAWTKLRQEANKVDISAVNRAITYDSRTQQVISFLDTIDIAKGKLPGRIASELNFITPYDPATYGVGLNSNRQVSEGSQWNDEYVGKTWWDLTQCRVLDYEQGELEYRRNQWNKYFPGSVIKVYEWIESNYLPSEYIINGGEGTPAYVDDSSYSVVDQYVEASNKTQPKYYFWVTSRDTYPTDDVRKMSTNSIERQLEDPTAAGLKFMSIISPSAMMFNNLKTDLSDDYTILSINYDRIKNNGVLHSEFELVSEGNAEQVIPPRIWNKIVDSMAGADSESNIVPDNSLSAGEKYGIQIRPKQTIFVNQQEATKVMVSFVNQQFAKIPVVRSNSIAGFTVSESKPTSDSGEWVQRVADVSTRDYLNIEVLPAGHTVLVDTDEVYNSQWTIYELKGTGADKYWNLNRIQGFNTSNYWEYITWYAPGYTSATVPEYQVSTEPELLTLTSAVVGEVAKVLINDDGNFSLFVKTETSWNEVVIQNGTIKLRDSLWDHTSSDYGSYIGFDNSSYDFGQFDRVPHTEIRQILTTLKNDIFINENSITFNKLFFRLIEYALSEQNYSVDWVFKSSFIKVAHKQRDLAQYPTYKNDNSQFVESFINEVKPYHTKIREYVTSYDGDEPFQGDITDFDVHAFYDEQLGYFRKPSNDFQGDNLRRAQGLNKTWNDNYSYYLDSIAIHNSGTGFSNAPDITISAPDLKGGTQAVVQAMTNGNNIIKINVTTKGSGYTKTPTLTIAGPGTGAVLLPRIANDTSRGINTTLKFDRIRYASTVKAWVANTSYDYQDLVWYKDKNTKIQEVYQVIVTGGTTTGATFSTEDSIGTDVFKIYADESLASAADRIEAYYVPNSGMVGDDLSLLQQGTDYSATRVQGVGFDREPGFGSARWDVVGFDDFEVDVDGLQVLSGANAFDTTISSVFKDLALGTRPEDINVDGGEFVDVYNSHAPEEVIPGRIFDTLDIEVYTDPSDDFSADGNSFPITYRTHIGDGTTKTFSYASLNNAEQVTLVIAYLGATPNRAFTLNYETRTISFTTAPALNSNIYLYGYGSTGEKITHEETMFADGSTIAYALAIETTRATQMQVLLDGVETNNYTYADVDKRAVVTFGFIPTNGAEIHVLTSSQDTTREAFTKPVQQIVTLDGSTQIVALAEPILYAPPFAGNMIVELNGQRLTPTNGKHHTLDGSTLSYAAPSSKGETLTNTTPGQIGVAVIKKSTNETISLSRYQDYDVQTLQENDITADLSTTKVDSDIITADADGSILDFRAVTLYDSYTQGDSLIVYYNNGEYTCDGSNLYINETVEITNGDELSITIFSNHNPLRTQTQVFKGPGTSIITNTYGFDDDTSSYDSRTFDESSETGTASSRYTVDRALTSSSNLNYLWVTVDGTKLHPGQYQIDSTGRLDLSEYTDVVLGPESIIVMTGMSENIIQPTTGFRLFYDMLGTPNYYRLSADNATRLTKNLYPTDTKVYLDDASVIAQVDSSSRYPGVIFVGNERITYWEVNTTDNYITNIRRGTSGTRFANIHRAETYISDGSEDQRMPETTTHTHTWYTKGTTTASNGLGLQESSSVNALFIKSKEASVPNYLVELSASEFIVDNYIEDDYVEVRQ